MATVGRTQPCGRGVQCDEESQALETKNLISKQPEPESKL